MSSATLNTSLPRRISRPRKFYADFASASSIHEFVEELDEYKYVWHMPQHMGGRRRSRRQICMDEIKRVADMGAEFWASLSL